MNKNFKVIQIQGLSGLLLVVFLATGLLCGFFLFPIWVIMTGWNALMSDVFHGPSINYLQAAMLWAIITLSMYMVLRNSISIRIQKEDHLKDIDIKQMIQNSNETKEEENIENEVNK